MPALADLTSWVTAACFAIVSVGFGTTPAAFASEPSQTTEAESIEVLIWIQDGSELAPPVEQRGWRVAASAPIRQAVESAREAEVQAQAQTMRDADTTLERVQRAFLEQRWDDMSSELAELESQALGVLATPPYCGGLWELQFRRYLAFDGAHDAEQAEARLRFAVVLDQQRRPLREIWGPDVVQAHLEAVEAVRADPPRPVTLRVVPDDARVLLDCAPVDPSRPQPLVSGLHVVHVVAPGYEPTAKVFDTSQTDRVEVEASRSTRPADEAWGASLAYGDYDPFSPSSVAALAAAAQQGGATAAVLVGEHEGKPTAQAVGATAVGRRVEGKTFIAALTEALFDLDEQGRIRIVTPQLRATVELGPGRVTIAERPTYKKAWPWITLGLAVALGLGLGLGLRAEPPGPSRIQIVAPR